MLHGTMACSGPPTEVTRQNEELGAALESGGPDDVDLDALYAAHALAEAHPPLGEAVEVRVDGKGEWSNGVTLPDEVRSTAIEHYSKSAGLPAQALERISARLLNEVNSREDSGTEDATVEVAVTFAETIAQPRFPTMVGGEPADSPRNQLVEARARRMSELLMKARQPGLNRLSREMHQHHGAQETGRFELIQGLTLRIRLSEVRSVLARSDVTYIQHAVGDGPPPATVLDGRAMHLTDPYFASYSVRNNKVGFLDTGMRSTHTLFSGAGTNDRINGFRDCYNGTSGGCLVGDNLNPEDDCWGHGTGMATVLSGNNTLGNTLRGAGQNLIDSFNVYAHSFDANGVCNGMPTAAAVDRALSAATIVDKVIMINTQHGNGDNDAYSQAANAAFDRGSVILAAAGNQGGAKGSVTSPGRASKVLGVGGVQTDGITVWQNSGRGPATDSRTKPDIAALYTSILGTRTSDIATFSWQGTSVSTPYATAAAAEAWEFLRLTFGGVAQSPGMINAFMILTGNSSSMDNNLGAGVVKMPLNASLYFSSGTVSQSTTNTHNWTLPAGRTKLRVVIWFPVAPGPHNDVDLVVNRPNGLGAAFGTTSNSVFEIGQVSENLASGSWSFQVSGYSVSGSQSYFIAAYHQ